MDALISLDHALFAKINSVWVSSWADSAFPIITDIFKQPIFVYGFFLPLLIFMIYKHKKAALKVIFAALLVHGCSEVLNSEVYKPNFKRTRPEFVLEKVKLRTHSTSSYSFPSSHASNAFATLTFLSLLFPIWSWALLPLAALTAYSRVYVGVHFPIDVIVGSLSGALIGFLLFLLLRRHLRA